MMPNKPNSSAVLKRRASRQRGVAMVEGAIIFPIMCMFLVMLELAHHSFDGYVTAGHVARERAWSSATKGSAIGSCPDGRDDTNYSSKASYITNIDAASSDPKEGDAPNPSGGGFASAPAGVPGSNGFFKHTAEATAHVEINRGGFILHPTAKSVVTVYCNQPYIGGLFQIIKNLVSAVF